MVRLLVAEKPSVARDLAYALDVRRREPALWSSPTLWITWCIGHMAELCPPEAYDATWKVWRAGTLPMLPERFALRPQPTHTEHWQRLAALLLDRRVSCVINACDAGREGELIFRFAMELAGSHKPVQRLWLQALTEQAVRHAMGALRPASAYDALAAAARCRAEADWIIGLNATRAMTLRCRPARGQGPLLSVGRVQTPTLGLIVARERAIEAFTPRPYWQVLAHLSAPEGAFWGTYVAPGPNPAPVAEALDATAHHAGPTPPWPLDRLTERRTAETIAAAVRGQPGRIVRASYTEQAEPPPLLYDLTALQRRANVRYGMTARATLEAAQALYERHKAITYPRTDATRLPQALAPSLPGILRRLAVGAYAAHVAPLLGEHPFRVGTRIVDDAGVTDHHAIIPTGRHATTCGLGMDEGYILDLIVRRFIAAFYPPARYARAQVDADVRQHMFRSRGRTLVDAGWQAVDPPQAAGKPAAGPAPASAKQAPESTAAASLIPHVQPATRVQVDEVKLREGHTRPPPHLTEATLLLAMEHAGHAADDDSGSAAIKDWALGTPATRAAIIEVLKKRDFVRVEGKNLRPTEHGRALIDAMPIDALKSAQLTGLWEARLSQMARGAFDRDLFMRQVRDFAHEVVRSILSGPLPGAFTPSASGATHASADAATAPRAAAPAAAGAVRQTRTPRPAPKAAVDAIPQASPVGRACRRSRRQPSGRPKTATAAVVKPSTTSGAMPSAGATATVAKTTPAASSAAAPAGGAVLNVACPLCGAPVRQRGKVYACAQAQLCTFVIFCHIAQRSIGPDLVRELVGRGRTTKLDGFVNREGRPFAAALVLSPNGRVNFDFSPPGR